MNAINAAGMSHGYAASAIIQLGRNEPVRSRGAGFQGDEVVLEAVKNPPRIGETRPIAALLPDVLARYGLSDRENAAISSVAFDITG